MQSTVFPGFQPSAKSYKTISKKRRNKNLLKRKKLKTENFSDEPSYIIVEGSGAFLPKYVRTCADPNDYELTFKPFDIFEIRLGGGTNNFPDKNFIKLSTKTNGVGEEWIWLGFLKANYQKYESASVQFRECMKNELAVFGIHDTLWKVLESMLFY